MIKIPERTVATAEDWYQVYNAEAGYEDMLDILEWNVEMDLVNETYYEQNIDNNMFRADVTSTKKLDDRTTFVLDIKIHTRSPGFGALEETEKGKFGMVTLTVNSKLSVNPPSSHLMPDFLQNFFKKIWWNLVYKDEWERWEEYAVEWLRRFMNEMRNYYDLEMRPGKAQRVHYEPIF